MSFWLLRQTVLARIPQVRIPLAGGDAMLGRRVWSVMCAMVLVTGTLRAVAEEKGDGRLTLVESVP